MHKYWHQLHIDLVKKGLLTMDDRLAKELIERLEAVEEKNQSDIDWKFRYDELNRRFQSLLKTRNNIQAQYMAEKYRADDLQMRLEDDTKEEKLAQQQRAMETLENRIKELVEKKNKWKERAKAMGYNEPPDQRVKIALNELVQDMIEEHFDDLPAV